MVGVLCVVIILVIGVVLSIPPKTLDFRGEVVEVTVEENIYTFRIVYVTSSYVVVADARTKVYRESNPKNTVSLQDIQVGDTIEGDYRLLTNENQAKFIRIWG